MITILVHPPSHPPFIDTHIHASQYPNQGIFGTTSLLDWLSNHTFPMESSLSDLAKAKRVYKRVVDSTLSHGSTTCCYYATLHNKSTKLLAKLCLQAGQRAFIGRVCMDSGVQPDYYRDESVEAAIEGSKEVIAYCREIDPEGRIVRPILTPRFAPSCTEYVGGTSHMTTIPS